MNNKLTKPEVERLFLEGKDVKDILALFPDLPSSTLYAWIKRYKWAEIRDHKIQKYTKSPEIMLDMLEKLIDEVPSILNDEETSTSEKASSIAKISDSISKVCRSIKNLSKDKDRLSSILFAVGELGKYMNGAPEKHLYDAEFREKFDKLLTGFSGLMLEKYSSKNIG